MRKRLRAYLRRTILSMLGLEIVEEVFGDAEDAQHERLTVRAIVQLKT